MMKFMAAWQYFSFLFNFPLIQTNRTAVFFLIIYLTIGQHIYFKCKYFPILTFVWQIVISFNRLFCLFLFVRRVSIHLVIIITVVRVTIKLSSLLLIYCNLRLVWDNCLNLTQVILDCSLMRRSHLFISLFINNNK